MRRVLKGLVALVALVCASPSGPAVAGELLSQSLPSAALGRDMPYIVYLPDGYRDGAQRYPVLYLLHGAGGNETVFPDKGNVKERADRLIASGEIPPTIIVSPGCPACWWVDGAKDKAETAFWADLVPAIETRFRALTSRQGRLIAGLSAGGYGAVRFAMKYPERVAAVAALSPAVYAVTPPTLSAARTQPAFLKPDGTFNQALWSAENYPRLSARYFDQATRVPFYLVAGDGDKLGIAYETALLFKTLQDKQPDLVGLRIVDGGHDWGVWGRTLDDAMRYMYRFVAREHASGKR